LEQFEYAPGRSHFGGKGREANEHGIVFLHLVHRLFRRPEIRLAIDDGHGEHAGPLGGQFDGQMVIDDIDDLVDDLRLFCELTAERFPAWESLPSERVIHDEVFGDRVRLLKLLLGNDPPKVVVTSIQSLLQPVPDRKAMARQTRSLQTGSEIAVEELSKWLVCNGFHNTSAVELPGEFSVRGGIVDIFAPDWYDPVRVELFGDEIESIRRFEVSNQRSLATLDAVDVTILQPDFQDRAHLTDFLPGGSWFLLIEPDELEQQGRDYLQRLERPQDFHSVSAAMAQVLKFPSVVASAVAAGSFETTCQLKIESVERFSGDINKVRDELDAAGSKQEVFVVCQTEAEADRLAESAAAQALRARLEDADAELTAMSLSLEQERQAAEDTLTLLAGAQAAEEEVDHNHPVVGYLGDIDVFRHSCAPV
ncbi:hypothetical protein LCGC14_2140600, partial [marine sediment metagenome]